VSGPAGLSESLSVVYANNVGAGAASASASYPGSDNYLGSSDSKTFTIAKASASISITWDNSTYDGDPNAASAQVDGVGGETDLSPAATLAYHSGSTASGSPLAGAPTDAGTYTVEASFAGNDNYNAKSATKTITIAKAGSTTVVSCAAGPFTYTGSAQTPCSVAVTGAGGLDLTPAPNYADNVNSGTATASYTFAGDANHLGSNGSDTFVIGKAASTTTVTCTAGPFIYNGSAQTPCSVSVTGAGGLNLTPAPSYENNVGAGTATAAYTYAGDANHTGSDDSKQFTIGKASSTTTVTCPAAAQPYTGSAITPCTAAATGAGGLDASRPVSYADNTAVGTASASASFDGDDNHDGSSGSATFAISKAPSVVTVTCGAGPFTYTGSAHEPCTAGVTGAGGLDETLPVTYANNVNAGSAMASASYAGDANHTGDSSSKSFTIAKAPSTVTVTCPSAPIPFTGSAITPCSAKVTGVGGLDQSLTIVYSANVNPGTATASAAFAGDANHLVSNGSATFAIGAWYGIGFYQPIGIASSKWVPAPGAAPAVTADTVWNAAKGGSTIPLKFNLFTTQGGQERTATADVKEFQASKLPACTGGAGDEVVEEFATTGATVLRYDTTGAQFIQNWATPKVSADTCYRVNVRFQDGSAIYAFIKLKK
jgi:hypothetical protein